MPGLEPGSHGALRRRPAPWRGRRFSRDGRDQAGGVDTRLEAWHGGPALRWRGDLSRTILVNRWHHRGHLDAVVLQPCWSVIRATTGPSVPRVP